MIQITRVDLFGWGVKVLLVVAGLWGRKLVILSVFCKWMFSKSGSTHALWMPSTLPGHLFDTPVGAYTDSTLNEFPMATTLTGRHQIYTETSGTCLFQT